MTGEAELHVRVEGHAGRITLARPQALNALTAGMVAGIEAALYRWLADDAVRLVILDAEGERAFCSGGDIAELYQQARAGDYEPGRRFWRDEYRLNAAIYHYPKPIVAFLQGYTMGGGVGIGCHASHRVVGDGSRIAMPECGIGLVTDVGGTLLLARAPGRLGEYLALTSSRMGPGDALHAGFADIYLPEAEWRLTVAAMCESGSLAPLQAVRDPAPAGVFAAMQPEIDRLFGGRSLAEILAALLADPEELARDALKLVSRNAPLAMAATVELIHRAREADTIEAALTGEYRYVWRAIEQGDFVEGIRARIIDRDNAPRWRHHSAASPTEAEVAAMIAPLGELDLKLEKTP